MLAAPHLHNPLTLLRFAVPAAPATPATAKRTLRSHVCYHSRHRVSRSMPVSAPHMVYMLKRPRCDLVCVHLSQSRPHSHMSVPPKWEHILCAQLLPTREVQVPPLWEPTILLVQILEQERFGPLDQSAHLPVFLHLCTTILPGPDSIMRSKHAQQRRMERRHHKHERTRRRRT